MKSPYKMTMSLNVLNHLGIKLYSNVPSVISEVVANAWDADAELVEININDKDITIQDNGWENPRVESEDKTILNAKGTRVVYYKALLENAYENYNKFIEKRTDAGKLLKLIKEIESN